MKNLHKKIVSYFTGKVCNDIHIQKTKQHRKSALSAYRKSLFYMKRSLVARMKQSALPQCTVRHTFFIAPQGALHFKKAPSETLSALTGCGSRIRTNDLRVMSPTSYPCSTPRYLVYSRECLYIITRSLMFVKHFLKIIFRLQLNPLAERIYSCDFSACMH